MPQWLLTLIMAVLLAWWTTRLARSKGRQQPWLWGLAALIITSPIVPDPWRLLGMVPLLALIFLKAPQPRVDSPPRELACPKCQAGHSASQRYCISCGWELGRAYPEIGITAQEPGQETAETPQPTAEKPEAPEPVLASEAIQTTEAPSDPTPAPADEATDVVVEPEPTPKVPVYFGTPTATGMTERGIHFFNLGRTEESIDQFTKAIALDPNHKEAWERRAEAYATLGRDGDAAEDRRRLNAINPSSSTG